MAFTVKGEYKRLIKHKKKAENSKYKQMGFECGCVCGIVTRIEYLPKRYSDEIHDYLDEEVQVFAIAGWSKKEELIFTLMENDVSKRYQDRKYRYNKQYGILEFYPYK